MLTYWEILTAIQSNVPVNDSYAQLWGRKSQGGYTVTTYTGTLPAALTGTKAGYLHRYKIYGNTERTGTPTPENPIYPSECGELETTGAHAGQYKLSLTSAGQDVDIYLGESQTTRRIKKLVLTGEETIQKIGVNAQYAYYVRNVLQENAIDRTSFICTHIPNVYNYQGENPSMVISFNMVDLFLNIGKELIESQPSGNTVEGLKEYLAAQYAAGTPVTVWYVLAEPETAVVNEPLMKIGNYADTIDSTQTTAQIPTSAGSTTISWAGEGLTPSQVELEYEKKR